MYLLDVCVVCVCVCVYASLAILALADSTRADLSPQRVWLAMAAASSADWVQAPAPLATTQGLSVAAYNAGAQEAVAFSSKKKAAGFRKKIRKTYMTWPRRESW